MKVSTFYMADISEYDNFIENYIMIFRKNLLEKV